MIEDSNRLPHSALSVKSPRKTRHHPIIKIHPDQNGDWVDRFRLKVCRAEDSECWGWKGRKNRGGYGSLSINGKTHSSHRLAYSLHHGSIDPSLGVHHSCDNPGCVNPAHLSQGDQLRNMEGAVRRDRVAFAKRNASTKLTTDQVIEIYTRGNNGVWPSILSKEFGIRKRHIIDIVRGRARVRETKGIQKD